MQGMKIREARKADIPKLMALLAELAAYENMGDRFLLTDAQLSDALFVRGVARAVLAELGGEAAAMAIVYPHFATFTGGVTLYMEELVVAERFRGRGLGRAMLRFLARMALAEGYCRVEWPCMLENASALGFYEKIGASRLSDRVGFRINREGILALAQEEQQ